MFEVLLRKSLLKQWHETPKAKLRTMLCAVTCRVQANYARSKTRREISAGNLDLDPDTIAANEPEKLDIFYTAWVEDLLQKCLNQLVLDYHRQGKGDYVRVIYGRVCEGLTIAQVAEALTIPRTAVDNYFRHAKKKLHDTLRSAVQSHVLRYSGDGALAEFETEWGTLANYLAAHGGLETAMRSAVSIPTDEMETRRSKGVCVKHSQNLVCNHGTSSQ